MGNPQAQATILFEIRWLPVIRHPHAIRRLSLPLVLREEHPVIHLDPKDHGALGARPARKD